MERSWSNTEFHERVAWARARAGYKKKAHAADALGEKPGTYRTWEVGKADNGRVPSLATIQHIARKFGVSWLWLLAGTGGPDDEAPSELKALAEHLAGQIMTVPDEKRGDALGAIEGVLSAYTRKAG